MAAGRSGRCGRAGKSELFGISEHLGVAGAAKQIETGIGTMQTLIFFAQNLHNALFVIFNLLNFNKNIFVKLSSENPRVGGSIPSPSTIKKTAT